MGGFILGSGARALALVVGVGAVLVSSRAAAQGTTSPSAPEVVDPPAIGPAAAASAPPVAGLSGGFLVPPVDGIGHGRKRKVVTPDDYRPVWVTLHVPSRAFVVLGEGDGEVASCADQCQFWVYAGTYHVRLANVPGEDSKTYRLRVGKPGDYTLILGDDAERDTGLALGITGSAGLAVGVIVLFAGLIAESDCGQTDGFAEPKPCTTPPAVYYGLATMGAGAAIGTVGFVLFGDNISRFRYDGAPMPVMTRVGAIAVPGGARFGTTLSF